MAGDPRNTRRWRNIRDRWFQWGEANQTPCARTNCTLGPTPIRYDLRGTRHPAAPHLGHIIEVDRGIDPYDETNLQLEHQRCNTSAGARYGNNKRRKRPQSRRW